MVLMPKSGRNPEFPAIGGVRRIQIEIVSQGAPFPLRCSRLTTRQLDCHPPAKTGWGLIRHPMFHEDLTDGHLAHHFVHHPQSSMSDRSGASEPCDDPPIPTTCLIFEII